MNFRIFRNITAPTLFAVHRVDSEGNRVYLIKDDLSFEAAQELVDNLQDLSEFEVLEEMHVSHPGST